MGRWHTSFGTVAESVGNPTTGTCAAGHTYAFPGVYDVTVTVCDSDGDCGSDVLKIAIGLNFCGFTQPLNDPAVSTATPSLWKRGNIPLKFQLRDAAGAPIPDSIASAIAAACSSGEGPRVKITKLLNGAVDNLLTALETETSSSPTADGGVCFRYDGTADQFIYNLGTKTSFYTVLPDTYRASATVTFNGGVIASHTQANTFGLK